MVDTLSEGIVIPAGSDPISKSGVDEMRTVGATANAAIRARATVAALTDARARTESVHFELGQRIATVESMAAEDVEAVRGEVDSRLAGIATAYDVWLSAGNVGTVEDYLAAQKGDQGDPGPYGGTEVTDPQVASYISAETETRAALDRAYRRTITPQEFGAVGDGVTDDTTAVRAAITDGRPVHWGSGTYRITSPIEVTATGPTVWTSESATIVADFAEVATYMLTIHAAGHDVTSRGVLTFDAARHAHTCVRFWTRFARASITAEDLRATRAYRSVLALIGGDGIEVGGGWDRVHLTRPTVTDVGMAVGAGASGTKGVSGIYIHEINRTGGADTPYDVRVIEPMITDIYSEDPAWKVDQDGIRIFGAPEVTGGPVPTIATVRGGEIRDSLGRSLKIQTPNASVEGVKLVRSKGGQGTQYDIDFQRGGGTVNGLECEYRGAAPAAVISASGDRTNALVPQTVISGVKVTLADGAALPHVVWATSYLELERSIVVRDVIVKGGIPDVIVLLAGVSDGRIYLSMSGVVATVRTSFVRVQSGSPNGWDLDVSATGCINASPVVKPLVTAHSSLARFSASASALVRLTA